MSGQSEPVFGAIWMTARASANRDARTVELQGFKVTKVVFLQADADKQAELGKTLEDELTDWKPVMKMDELTATLELADVELPQAADLGTEPPEILYSDSPALLVSIDGKPLLRQRENSNLVQVVNTPFLIVLSYETNLYYLYDGKEWLQATDVPGPWGPAHYPPATVVELTAQHAYELTLEFEARTPDNLPKIIIATKPSELIVTDGPAKYSNIDGIGLSYLSNSESRLLKEDASDKKFVLLSGRWYTSDALQGPWTYLEPSALPADFSKIPPKSAVGEVLTSIPGTQEAKDAAIDAAVPQMAAIKRDQTIAVSYDGTAKFEPIEGTEMQYAINTDTSVIMVDGTYYCVDQGVWYVADKAWGPWVVATSVPDDIHTIPANSPVYNASYVHVFDSNDEEVYAGYYPGYYGSYLYGDNLVYGTGWRYRPWSGVHFYARPATWGFQVHYNPRFGWGFGPSYKSGYFPYSVGFRSWNPCCFWGPSRWGARGPYDPRGRYDPRSRYNPLGPANSIGRYDTRGAYDPLGVGDPRGAADPRGPHDPRGVGDPHTLAGVRGTPGPQGPAEPLGGGARNNVYSDPNGDVYRHSNGAWESRGSGGWNAGGGAAMEPAHQARSRGASRAGGMHAGGGGRRR